MQIKTINKVIRAKIEDWILSIDEESLRNDLRKHVLVTGGCIVSMLLGEEVNDFDVYLKSKQTALDLSLYYARDYPSVKVMNGAERTRLIDQYRQDYSMEEFLSHSSHEASFLRNLKEDQIKLFISTGSGGYKVTDPILPEGQSQAKYRPKFFSPNAISLSDDIQIVIRFHGTEEEIHKTFDYIHATNYWTYDDGVVTNIKALESIITKTLVYQGSMYPLTSIIRMKKFVARKWTINAGEILKMMFQISLLDLQDMDVLEEQLIGVDVAYFETLINALRTKLASDKGFSITPAYFNEIVDRVFGANEEAE